VNTTELTSLSTLFEVDMDSLITDNQELKYNVVDATGKTLREGVIRAAAVRFIESLDENAQTGVRLVPFTPSGDQVLFG